MIDTSKASKHRSMLMMMHSSKYTTMPASNSSTKLVKAVKTHIGRIQGKLIVNVRIIEKLRNRVEARHLQMLAKVKAIQRFVRQMLAAKYFERCVIAANINQVLLMRKNSKVKVNFVPNSELTKRFLAAIESPYHEYKLACVHKHMIHSLKVAVM